MKASPEVTAHRLWGVLRAITNGQGGQVSRAHAVRLLDMPALTFEAALRQLLNAKRVSIGRGTIHVLIPYNEATGKPPRDPDVEQARQVAKRETDRKRRERLAIEAGVPIPRRNASSERGECRCRKCPGIKTADQFHLLWRAGKVYRDYICKRCRERVQLWRSVRILREGTQP